jgi:drug/metabolite transporter (DMT)-like permease
MFSISLLKIAAQCTAQYAIAGIGSGQFTVINAFIVVVIALLNSLVYNKTLSRTRFAAVCIISVFVCISGWGQYSAASDTV